MSVVIYVENIEGQFKKSVFETLSYAKEIADQTNTKLTAISIGDVAESQLKELGKYGANKVLTVNNERLKSFVNQAYSAIIAKAVEEEKASILVMSSSFSGKGLAPRVAVKLQAGLAQNVINLPKIDSGKLSVKRGAFSGKAFATVELSADKKILTLAPNAYKIVENIENIEIVDFQAQAGENDFGTLIKELVRSSDKVSLPDAELVISGGRGMKGPENWGMIEELAALLGAATACSKPVSDAGWRPHSEHVGQTGIAIAPNLYMAIGISGAIQHLAGISSSKVIVVINKDPEAPFFKVADYGIVGDAFEVVPQLIEAVKKMKA